MTYFTPAIDKYFAAWILPTTWYKPDYDEERFFRFVLALDRYSRPVKNTHMADSDAKPARSIHNGGLLRNPRTYDQGAMKRKILQAVKQNHNFHKAQAERYASRFASEARLILDCLWVSRIHPIGDKETRKWQSPLK